MKKETKLMINELIANAAKDGEKVTEKIRPIMEVGKGRYSQYSVDHTVEYCEYIDSLKLKYILGNDSARGGKLGKFIQIKVDRRNSFVKDLIK